MRVKLNRERCNVCGRLVITALNWSCFHTPEEHARADVAEIMKRHSPAIRTALSQHEDSGEGGR